MKTRTIMVAASVAAATTAAAFAHGGATGIVKQRMDGMMAMGKALTAIGDMFKGKTEFDADKIAAAAVIVKSHSAEIVKLFPDTQASRKGKGTEALPSIWERKGDFQELAQELERRAAELETVSAAGDKRAIRISFAKVSKTCASCHTDFRKPKK